MKENKDLNIDLTLFIKINLKWIIDLNVKHKTVKFLDYNIKGDLEFGNE
jgi:hypothetical protein